VFDRFWQGRKGDRRGAGLGLSIARGIIEAHGGRLWVESQLGKGTTFYFSIPLQRESSEASSDDFNDASAAVPENAGRESG
jgi:signal transduction histidine kinase